MLNAALEFLTWRLEHSTSCMDMGASHEIRNQQSQNRVVKLYPSVPPCIKSRTEQWLRSPLHHAQWTVYHHGLALLVHNRVACTH